MNLLTPLLIIAITSGLPSEERYPQAKQVFYCDFLDSWDKNYDAWPDGWTRRRGAGFPHYVPVRIRSEPSPAGNRCLRIDLDSAAAAAYSPTIDISPLFSYVLQGQLKTEGLHHDRAFLSLTFLDAKRRRLETFYSKTLKAGNAWTAVRIGPVAPQSEAAREAVIGLHLQPLGGAYAGEGADVLDSTAAADLSGSALFDDIWLGRLPRVSLGCNAPQGIFLLGEPIRVQCRVSGFSQSSPRIEFFLEDHRRRLIAQHRCGLDASDSSHHAELLLDAFADEPVGRLGTAAWEPPVGEPGFYRLRVEIKGMEHLHTIDRQGQSAFVVMEKQKTLPNGQFGWSLTGGDKPLKPAELAGLLSRMGVGYVKYPLWYGKDCDESRVEELRRFAERLDSLGIALVGVLDDPPQEVAAALVEKNRPRAADVFLDKASVWLPSVETALTRFADKVQYWQLGDDRDTSFGECVDLGAGMAKIKTALDRVDDDIRLGIAWNCANQFPRINAQPHALRVISLTADPPLGKEELDAHLRTCSRAIASVAAGTSGGDDRAATKLSLVLQPLDEDRCDDATRVVDLVQRMITAKINSADSVTITQPFDDRRGLFSGDAVPGVLLLPWHTTAAMLSGSRYLGQIQLPNRSRTRVFARGDEAVMVVWNERPCEEVIYLGEKVYQIDVWGRKTTPPLDSHRQVIRVEPTPSFVVGLNKDVCLWRMALEFEKPRIASIPGRAQINCCRFQNTLPCAAAGGMKLVADKTWRIQPAEMPFRLEAGEQCEQHFKLTLPYEVLSGAYDVRIDCTLQAERLYRFSVYRTIEVGLGDVYIEYATQLDDKGNLCVAQRFVNGSRESVSFRCLLSAPGRRRMGTLLNNIPPGSTLRTYVLPDGKELIGKTLRLRAAAIDGQRKLNYQFVVEDKG